MLRIFEIIKTQKLAYRIVFALILLAIATILRFKFIPYSGGPFVTFYPAIILSFYLCGAIPGSILVLISGIIGTYYFIPPFNQLSLNLQIPTSVIFFFITSGMIGVISVYQQRIIAQRNIILDNEMIGSMILKNRKIKWCNKAMSKILGYPESTLSDASTRILFADQEMFDEVGREAYPLKDGLTYRKQFEMKNAEGQRIWVDVSGATVSYDKKKSLWLVNDISVPKTLEMKLKNQVDYDYLTGVHSRVWFMNQSELELNRSVRYGSALSLLMVDIDFFKRINDTYGHQAGDLILKKFAEISRNSLREFDICGRLGGEEFAILLPETPNEAAVKVAERLRSTIETTNISLQSDELTVKITVSIGVTSLISKEDTISDLLNKSDIALYEAKKLGRNKVCLWSDNKVANSFPT